MCAGRADGMQARGSGRHPTDSGELHPRDTRPFETTSEILYWRHKRARTFFPTSSKKSSKKRCNFEVLVYKVFGVRAVFRFSVTYIGTYTISVLTPRGAVSFTKKGGGLDYIVNSGLRLSFSVLWPNFLYFVSWATRL